MTAKDVLLQIILMATVARLGRRPPASTEILRVAFADAAVLGPAEPLGGAGDLTVIRATHEGRPYALVTIDARDAKAAVAGELLEVWHGGTIAGTGYGVAAPSPAQA